MKNYVKKSNYSFLVLITFLSLIINFNSLSQNPISSADNFNILTEGNLSITAGDIEGAIGVGGNLSILGNAQRTSANATGAQAFVLIGGIKYAVVVGGGLSGVNGGNIFKIDGKSGATDDHFIRFNTISPSTAAGNGGGIDIGSPVTNNLNRYIRVNSTTQTASSVVNSSQLLDFSATFATFKANSTSISGCTGNVIPTVSGGQATINLGANSNNVWNVSGATLNSYNQINLTGNLPSANRTLIINVNNAGTFNWSNLKFVMGSESDNYMEINRAPYIIWNFYNTTTLNIQNSNLVLGSILAPFADLKNNGSGNITGQIIAKSFTKPYAGELHIAKFNGNVLCGIAPASLGDYVWEDKNANGIQESGEQGIGGVVVKLSNGVSTTTNSNGFYSFTGLIPGTYTVTFNTPNGYLSSPIGTGTSSTDSNGPSATVTLASGENNLTIDAGFYKLATLGDFVWYDLNQNGIQDNRIDPNNGAPIDLGKELPVSNIKIELYKADGTFLDSKFTGADGKYLFENLTPGNYFVKLDPSSLPSSAYILTNLNAGSNAAVDSDIAKITYRSIDIQLTSGENDLSWDLGVYSSSTPEISDPCGCEEKFIYTPPTQNNYLYTETVTVHATPGGVWRVIASNPNTGAVTNGVLQDTPSIGFNPTDSDPIGDLMTEVSPGVYEYKFYHFEKSSAENNYELVVSDGTNILDIHAKCNSIKEKYDNNLNDVCAYASPLQLQTTFDTGTAEYYFIQNSEFIFTSNFDENLLIQAAKGNPITQLNPADYAPGSTVALYIKWLPNSNGQPGTSCPKTLVLNVTLGLDPTKCLATIGDRVWVDENKSGIQDEADSNLEGVVVTLYDESGSIVTKDGLGATLSPITTTNDGHYAFTNLKPGAYQVHFSLAFGYQRVVPDQTQDANNKTSLPLVADEVDSDANFIDGFTSFYILNAGDINLTADAGFQKSVALPIKIVSFNAIAKKNSIDLVWNTANAENFSHFEVQKSLNAKEFGYIGTVNAKNARTYTFTDFSPELNTNYYRLKMVDLDGSTSYSKVVSVAYESENQFTTVQNPAVNGTMALETNLKNPIFSLSTSIGSAVNIKVMNESVSRYIISVPNYTSGIYYLSISSDGKSTTKKVLIP